MLQNYLIYLLNAFKVAVYLCTASAVGETHNDGKQDFKLFYFLEAKDRKQMELIYT